MIPDETVERVRDAADIVEIISEFVPLKRSGGTWRGPCPFHQGKNPNFSVSPSHGSYHCFVCHESGDVFTFIRKRLSLDWPSAVRYIGDKVGIEVVDTPRRAEVVDPNAPNHEVLAAAGEWFQRQLREDGGRAAREYLQSRGLDEDAWTRFGLGFAPRDAHALRRYLHSLGADDARQLEAGLLALREGDAEPRIRFRGRVMFPIHDERGRPVGFGGRAMGDDAPKYLNSPESPVFQKRRTLYGLHVAKQAMRRASRAIVVEGYLDAIRLMLAGIEEVVAPLGTALTEEQAQLLVRYASEVFLLYDSDDAGQKATFRSGLELLRTRATVRVVSLPDGDDPDSFVRTHGRAAMESQLQQAIDLFDRQVQLLERRGWFADLRHRRTAIDKLLPTIRAAQDPLTRDLYLARLSAATQLDKSTLVAEAEAFSERDRRGSSRVGRDRDRTRDREPASGDSGEPPPYDGSYDGAYDGAYGANFDGYHGDPDGHHGPSPDGPRHGEAEPQPLPPPPSEAKTPWKGSRRGKPQGPSWHVTAVPPRPSRDEPVERALVRAMLADRGMAERVAERHPPDSFRDGRYRAIYDVLLHAPLDEPLDRLVERMSGDVVRAVRDLIEGAPFDAEAADIGLSLSKLDVRALEARKEEILDAMRRTDDRETKDQLMRERLDLETEIRRILPMRSLRSRPRS